MAQTAFSRFLLGTLRLAATALLLAAPADAATPLVDNGCPNEAGAPQANCSKLGHGERITVMATECGYSLPKQADGTCEDPSHVEHVSAEICRSIINDSNIDYFVPWRKPQEWGSFLSQLTPMTPMDHDLKALPMPINNLAVSKLPGVSVGQCCDPATVPQVCPSHVCDSTTPGYPHCGYPSSVGESDQLGVRRVGTRGLPLDYYGAQGDVTRLIKADDIYGDGSINYRVNYVCNQGAWVKFFEEGSCTPTAGQCKIAYNHHMLPNGFVLPQDLNQMCEPGSIYHENSLVDTGSGYTWTCDGTPGQPSQDCDASKYTAPTAYNGTCGPAHNGHLPGAPSTDAQKCSSGDVGPLSGLGTDASPWVWSCNGGNGGSSQGCKAWLLGTPLAGICGPANGYVANNPNWNPSASDLCSRTASTAMPVKSGTNLDWVCYGADGGADAACHATLKLVNGSCGVANSYVVTTPPHVPPIAADLPPGACSGGTPTNITFDSGSNTLYWDCTGANGGSTSNCSAQVDTTLIKGICRWAPGTVLGSIPPATSAALCASGTADNVVTSGAVPTVGITWNCLGNQPGYDASCNVAVHIKTDGACGIANGKGLAVKPAGGDLCAVGAPSAVSGGATGPVWGWTCAGLYGGLTAYCGAVYDYTAPGGNEPVPGACNPDKLVAQAIKPSGQLCSVGTPTTVNGSGPWTWQCQGINGGSTVSCLAPLLGAGYCGTTSGTRIPNKPNSNLCAVGVASIVTGNNVSGWDWTCTAANTVSCHADPCDACSGDLAASGHSEVIANQTITYGSGTCQVSGTVDWQSIDTLIPGNSTYTLDLANMPSGASYSKAQLPAAGPANYCTPCYRVPKTIVSGNFSVHQQTGVTCTTGTALDAGQTVTLPVTGSNIH